jgi:hypothetical protein
VDYQVKTRTLGRRRKQPHSNHVHVETPLRAKNGEWSAQIASNGGMHLVPMLKEQAS